MATKRKHSELNVSRVRLVPYLNATLNILMCNLTSGRYNLITIKLFDWQLAILLFNFMNTFQFLTVRKYRYKSLN